MYLIRCIAGGLVAAALAVAPAALAKEPGNRQSPDSCTGKDVSCSRAAGGQDRDAASAGAPGGFGDAADAGRLEHARGGSGGTTIDTRLNGSVSGNSATQVVTGDNIISSGSFANMTGIPIVIQNSGANVLIQNATVINLQLK